jgi:hypothetical protein
MGIWLSLLMSPSVAAERPKLHVTELLEWPYWTIRTHPHQERAHSILRKIDQLFTQLEKASTSQRPFSYSVPRDAYDDLVFDYFGLKDDERALIKELAEYAGPSLQPSSLNYGTLVSAMRRPPTDDQVSRYRRRLVQVLKAWRDATGGRGELHASVMTARSVPIGGVVVTISNSQPSKRIQDQIRNDSAVPALLDAIATRMKESPERMLTVPDLMAVHGKQITIVKPLVTRFWLERTAIEDATKLAVDISAIREAKSVA